jgi:predicted transcriptional regulator of viral defense system
MKWETLLTIIGSEAVFSSSLLLAGNVSVNQTRLQLTRWVQAGRLLQLRRGLYALAPSWRKVEPHPFLVANKLQHGTYVSLQSALSFHDVIPEHVPVVTSVGPGRPEMLRNPLGSFQFKHMTSGMLFGYVRLEVAPRQFAFVATAEKALLDLAYLTPDADSPAYLRELRLQNVDAMNMQNLHDLVKRSGKPKLLRTVKIVESLLLEEEGETL